jgi:hypothetical protein
VRTNSPMARSYVKPSTPAPKETTKMTDDEYRQ